MGYYEKKKEKARQEAKQWQYETSERDYFTSELVFFNNYFTKIGKRYGLLQEFKENGVL